jgi:hypothetical protein
MAAVFDHAADELRDYYLQNPDADREDASWIRGTRNYAAFLRSLIDPRRVLADVEVLPQARGEVMLRIGASTVMISSPRPSQYAALEAAIVTRYCDVWPCDTAGQRLAKSRSLLEEAQRTSGNWSFSDGHGPVFETEDGLEFSFADGNGLRWKKARCETLVRELRLVAYSIRHLSERGFYVDWNAISVSGSSPEHPQRVAINRTGDHAMIRIPTLQRTPDLLRRSLPWIRAQVEDRAYRQRFADAEQLLSGIP